MNFEIQLEITSKKNEYAEKVKERNRLLIADKGKALKKEIPSRSQKVKY